MKSLGFLVLGVLAVLAPQVALAGVFNIPQFVPEGQSAIGLEPEFILSNGAGVGFNAKYSYGVNDFSDAQAIIGTGTGPRNFRVGGNLVCDFFPDIDRQPGIGIAAQGLYVHKNDNSSAFELTGIPYIGKNLDSASGNRVKPFFAMPTGFSFSSGHYVVMSTAVVGGIFQHSEKIRYSMELGVDVNHSESYLSGGMTYYP